MAPTCDHLFEESVCWLAGRIDDARARHAREAAEAALQPSRREQAKELAKAGVRKIPVVGDLLAEPRPSRAQSVAPLNQRIAREEGRRLMEVGAGTVITAADADPGALASQLCEHWRSRKASPLAQAWLEDSKFDVETLMETDDRTLALIIGVAAAAAVLALVLLVRRGRSVSAHRREFSPSADFRALNTVASGEGAAAAIAARIQSQVAEPWSWSLADGLLGLLASDKRTVLAALCERRLCSVSAFAPTAGDAFDSKQMTTRSPITSEDLWVVAKDTTPERRGYRIADRTEVPPEVDVCTVDWWVLARPACAVGQVIVERADNLVPGGRAKASTWRAPWGLAFPEDLRELPEAELDSWRQRLLAELNPHYRDRPGRQLVLVGKPGDAFDSSMETEDGGPPVGDAEVAEVVLRDGVPQYGLACPGGSPLLLAVVRPRPSRGV